jgi:hypothetical protein
MVLSEDIEYVGRLLDTYAEGRDRMHVAAEDPEDAGVPPDMQAGPVNEDGWVEWKLLPSTLSEGDIVGIEEQFGVQFPPLFRSYLLARFHLFDQVRSRRHDQQIMMTCVPSGEQLGPLEELMRAWQPVIGAGFAPFAEWGDGWGPMCFDLERRGEEGDCPVVWMDHESLISLGPEACSRREEVLPLAQPLYRSCREFLTDVFARP